MDDDDSAFLPFATAFVALLSATVVLMDDDDDSDDDKKPTSVETKEQVASDTTEAIGTYRRMKRSIDVSNNRCVRRLKKYDYHRARRCIDQDYLGEDPLFGHQFERVFRITKNIFYKLLQICEDKEVFFQQRMILNGQTGICPEAKLMIALKQCAFGVSPSAFLDYFQMGETTARESLKMFCKIIATSELREQYLKTMSKVDAKRVSDLHHIEFGVEGCLGCLDCMHIYWRTCPAAWKGQFQGKEGVASIVLEAVADYSTWIWHCKFGFPGTLNDINIWDNSSLLKEFIDGTFDQYDFEYHINDKEKLFTKWQEGSRKSVERAFGILQRKFQILSRPCELWYMEDIKYIVETCCIMHNMMVEERCRRNESENVGFYNELDNDIEEEGNSNIGDNDVEGDDDLEEENSVENENNEINFDETSDYREPFELDRTRFINAQWAPGQIQGIRNDLEETVLVEEDDIEHHFAAVNERWDNLYNIEKHYALRDAIKEEIYMIKMEKVAGTVNDVDNT